MSLTVNYNAGTDNLTLAQGGLSAAMFSDNTLAFVVRRNTDNATSYPMISYMSGGSGVVWSVGLGPANIIEFWNGGVTIPASTLTITAADGWCIVVISKANGTTSCRISKYSLTNGGAWSHENTVITSADAFNSPAGGYLALGADPATSSINDEYGPMAFWTSVLSDVNRETLDNDLDAWVTLSPVAMWDMANPVVDSVGAADETGRTGITAGANAPLDFAGGTSVAVSLTSGTATQYTPAVTNVVTISSGLIAARAAQDWAVVRGDVVFFSDTFTGTDGDSLNGSIWTDVAGNGPASTIQSNRAQLTTGAGGSYSGFTRAGNNLITDANFEVLFDLIIPTVDESQPGVFFRSDANLELAYQLRFRPSDDWVEFRIGTAGYGYTSIGATQAYAMSAGDVVHCRLLVIGSTFKARMWSNSASEPEPWTIERTDGANTYPSAGRFYLINQNGAAAAAITVQFDNVIARAAAVVTNTIIYIYGDEQMASSWFSPVMKADGWFERDFTEAALTAGSANAPAPLVSATGATFTPTLSATATLTLSLRSATGATFTPTLSAKATITTSLTSASGATFTPTLAATATITAQLISASGAKFTPTLSTIVALTAPFASGSATLFTPTLSAAVSVAAALVAGSAALFTSTVTAIATVTAPLVSGSDAQFTPTLAANGTVTTSLIWGTATLFAPIPTVAATITASVISAVVALFTPSLTATGNITAPLLSGSTALFTPSLSTAADITATLVSGSAALFAPVISSSTTIAAALVSALATLYATSESSSVSVTADLISGAAALFTPSLEAAVTIAAALLSGAATQSTPTISATASITTTLISGGADLFNPIPSTAADTIVTAPLATGSGALFDPTIVTTATLIAPLISGSGQAYGPAPSASVTILTDVNNGSVVVFDPGVGAASVIYIAVPLIPGQSTLFDPSVLGTASTGITAPLVVGTGSLFGPTLLTETNISTVLISATGTLYLITFDTHGYPVKMWDGTQWVTINLILQVWNGSAWVVETRPVSVYNTFTSSWYTFYP